MIRRTARRRSLLPALVAAAALVMAGCDSGKDASVPQGGGFELVTPGGKYTFSYPAADRRELGAIAGPAVTGDARISVADYPDKIIVLNFWGSWCGPCRAESPYLAAASKDLASKGVQFIGINVQESDRSNGADFDAVRGTPYPSIYDRQMQILASIRGFPINAIPSTVVLDRQHRVAYINLREFRSPAELISAVSTIAAEK